MTDTTVIKPAPKKRRGLKIAGGLLAFLLILIAVAYFVGTSTGFLKSFILPRVGQSLNSEITVSDASIHPFSSVTLRDLKVTPKGRETLLTAPELRANYSLPAILRGNLKIEEVIISSPTIHLVQQPDGSSNLDPILNAGKNSAQKKKESGKEKSDSKPTQIDLQRLALSNATIRQERLYAGGQRDLLELSNVTVTLNNLRNGDSGKVSLSANALIQNHPPAPGMNGLLQAGASGEYVFALSENLKPLSIKGETQLKIARAEGAFADLSTLGVNLNADIAPTEIRQVALQFQKGGEALGELRASGPFNLEKSEGRLKIEMLSLDRRVLNLLGAGRGIDFGTTTLDSTNDLQLANAGKEITVLGQFNANRLQLTRTNQTTPTLNLRANYHLTVNAAASNAVLRALNIVGTQNDRPLLNAELTSPMTISLGGNSTVGDSALNLTVADLNLADWKMFLGNSVSQGLANLKLRLLSQQGGRQLILDIQSQLANVAPIGGDKKLASVSFGANLAVQLAANDQKQIRGGLQFSNVVVIDPSGSVPATPLEAKLQIDTTLAKDMLDLRQFQITLTPTARAQNQLQLAGRIDTSNTNALQGNLKLSAEALDLTTYYDLFTGATNQTTKTAVKSGHPSQPSGNSAPQQEPATQQLPFKNFVVEANLGKLFLREVEVANLQTSLKLDGGRVLLQPFALALNGAPVNTTADIDLSVPGWRYAVTFEANRIPIAPLANSFAVAYRGKATGDLLARMNLQGAGITGVNLQKNLSGKANLSLTNANIQVIGRWQQILTVIASALRVSELVDSPVTSVTSDIQIGDGKINLREFRAAGSAFAANSQGTIAIAPVLNDSKIQKLPINFALSRNLATQARLKSSTDTNNPYVDLGTIAHVSGTLADPKTQPDWTRIALLTGEQLGGTAGQVLRSIGTTSGTNANVGNLIQGLGGILGGRSAPSTNKTSPPNSNQPALTNQPPAPTNQEPLSDILRLLGPRKK